jgi:type IV fimbrial biogenesis protein FimT
MVSLNIEFVAGGVHASRRNRQMHEAYPEGDKADWSPPNSWDNRQEMEMKRNNAGFTLLELMIVIAIIAILSAIAVPNMIGWRERAKLQGAVLNLKGDLQWAKIRAIRANDLVTVVFDSSGYEIRDAADVTIRSRQLPAGVTISSYSNATFTARGRCPGGGDALLEELNGNGEQRQISINPLGLIR